MSGNLDPNTIGLKRPIKANGEDLYELALREPTTEEIMDIGQPFLLVVGGGETAIRIQGKVIGQWVSKLAGIPLSSVKALHRDDFAKAQAVVLGFFGQDSDEPASS